MGSVTVRERVILGVWQLGVCCNCEMGLLEGWKQGSVTVQHCDNWVLGWGNYQRINGAVG